MLLLLCIVFISICIYRARKKCDNIDKQVNEMFRKELERKKKKGDKDE
jgi:hypothetical protein